MDTPYKGSYYFRDAKWQDSFPSENPQKEKADQQLFTSYFLLIDVCLLSNLFTLETVR